MVFDTKTAQKILLDNLSSKTLQPASVIISPKQILSNCWFNTLFMVYFISDKGRKFFKFFRQLMIIGKTVKNTPIPPALWKSLSLLNLAIEGTLNGYNNLKMFDTNMIINRIYKSLPPNVKKKSGVYKVGEPGNPSDYYEAIINYLKSGNNIMPIKVLHKNDFTLGTKLTGLINKAYQK